MKNKTLSRCFLVISVPLLVALYFSAIIPLIIRQSAHLATVLCDFSFDFVARLAGFDSRYWPLPKAGDEPLPWKNAE